MKVILPLVSLLFSFQSMAAVGDTFSFQFKKDIALKQAADESGLLTARLSMGSLDENNPMEHVLNVEPGRKSYKYGCLVKRMTSPEVKSGRIEQGDKQWIMTVLKHEKQTDRSSDGIQNFKGTILSVNISTYVEEFELKNSDGVSLQMSCRNRCFETLIYGRKKGVSCENKIAASDILRSIGVNIPTDKQLDAEKQSQAKDSDKSGAGAT